MTRKIKLRSLLIGGLFTLFFIALIGRLYWVQVVDASWLMERAERTWKADKTLQPKRGAILDRNNKILAQDAKAFTVAVNPSIINSKNSASKVVATLAPLLQMTDAEAKLKLLDLVTKKRENGSFYTQVEIRNEGWKIDDSIAKQIKQAVEDEGLLGVYLIEEQKRYYPSNNLAAHLLGYANKEGNAVNGIELFYNDVLSGTPGSVQYERDALGYELPNSKASLVPAEEGQTIRLTIDQNIQHYVEEALEKVYEQYKPKSAMAIAADPNTLEILGMGNIPNYNPNQYWNFTDQSDFKNHTIASQFEPGSTFKIVTLAAAVEEKIFDPNALYKSGSVQVPGHTLRDHNWSGWGEITYLEGLKRSSNVAFVNMGYFGLGEDGKKLRSYIDRFGFGQKTGIDINGELTGVINFHYPSEIATATYGQGKVAVTAMQQIAAVAAIANGGKLMKPYLLKEVIDSSTGKVISETKPTEVRRVVSESTARKVSEYLEQVVSDQSIGTGRNAAIDGYRVAGKTGTANVVVNGKYSEDTWVVSFIGYAPVEDPRIIVIVIVDEPELGGDYRGGGDVAAPVFKDIVSKSLRYMGVSTTDHKSQVRQLEAITNLSVPKLIGDNLQNAEAKLGKNGLKYEVYGGAGKVIAQYPNAGAVVGNEQSVFVLTTDPKNLKVPDFSSKSMRDVIEICGLLQLSCSFTGNGYVIDQQITEQQGVRKVILKLSLDRNDKSKSDSNETEESEKQIDDKNRSDQPTEAG